MNDSLKWKLSTAAHTLVMLALALLTFNILTTAPAPVQVPAPVKNEMLNKILGDQFGKEVYLVDASEMRVHRDLFDGKQVLLTGFLAIDDGLFSIYPSEMSYENNINVNSFQIRAPQSQQKELFELHGYSYVRLIGTYVAHDENAYRSGRGGVIEAPIRVLNNSSRQKREQWNDVRIDVEDINR